VAPADIVHQQGPQLVERRRFEPAETRLQVRRNGRAEAVADAA
jgi:hypothetical protein